MLGRILPLMFTAARYAAFRPTSVLATPVKSWLTPQRVNLKSTGSSTTVNDSSSGKVEASDYDVDHDHDHGMELSVATLDDLEQVMELCPNIYNGVDYLPATFPHLVDGPGMQGFLFKVDGELVGFWSGVLLDGEQSMLIQSARVKESLQGHGLLSVMLQLFERHVSNRALYPHLRRLMSSSDHSMASKGYHAVLKKEITGRAFLSSSLSQFTLKNSPGRVSALRYDEVRELLQSDRTRWAHLFPQEELIVAMRPFAMMPENIPLILSSGVNTEFCVTKDADGKYAWMSAGSYYFCPAGIRYLVDIYGTVEGERDKSQRVSAGPSGSQSEAASKELRPSDSSTARDKSMGYSPQITENKKEIMSGRTDPNDSKVEPKRIPVKVRQDAILKTPDLTAGAQGRPEAQAVREHLIAHLRRLKAMRSTLPGRVIFDVYASDHVQEVMEDVTQELEKKPFVCPFARLVVWVKDFGDEGL